jgi:hypothetical protein
MSLAAATAALGLFAAAGANAAVIFAGPSSAPEMRTDSSFDVNFDGGAGGLADLSFILNGFLSLDGQNTFEDDFTLSLNNVALLSGTFNLGGGGNDVVFFAPAGASIDNVSGNGTAITFAGGQVNIATPLTLAAGANTLTFGYNSLTTPDFGFQGPGDEAWSAHDVLVTTAGDPVLAGDIPEPAAWALMLTGFLGAGAMLRRRRWVARTAVA